MTSPTPVRCCSSSLPSFPVFLADVLVAPVIVLDLADAVVSRPLMVRAVAALGPRPRARQVRIVCRGSPLRDVLGSMDVAVVASVEDAVSDLQLAG